MTRAARGWRSVVGSLALATAAVVLMPLNADALPSSKVGTAQLISPTAAATYYGTSTTSTNSIGSTARPAEIKELARALKGNPDLIYEHVRNNTEMVWTYGLSKGALGVIVDRSGNAFDQANLMVELLRESGYTSSYQIGTITLTGAQFSDWSGLTSATAACQLLASGGIPAVINGTTTANCAYGSATVSSIQLGHVWVSATIGSTAFVFDPAFKGHTFKAGMNLTTAASLTSGDALTAASTSTNDGTASGVNYTQSVNTYQLNAKLATYASNLSTAVAAVTTPQAIDDVVGGQVITETAIPTGGLRQVSLPYTATATRTITGGIPDIYRTSLNVLITKARPDATTPTIVNKTVYADEAYSRRLIFDPNFDPTGATFTGSLKLIDEFGVGPTLVTATYADSPDFSRGAVTLTLNAPYAAGADNSATVNGSYMNAVVSRSVTYALPFTIVMGFGDTGRGLIDKWGARPDTPMPASPTYACTTCFKSYKAFKGDGRRELYAAEWLAQSSRAARLHASIAKSLYTQHYSIGLSVADTAVQKTDTTGAGVYAYWITDSFDRLDVETGFSLTSKGAVAADRRAAALAIAGTMATLKGSVEAQVADLPDVSSVATRFAWGNAPEAPMDPFGGSARKFYNYLTAADATQALGLSKAEGVTSTTNDGIVGDPGIELGASETTARRQALSDAITAYVSAGFKVTTSEEAFLGPGKRGGALRPSSASAYEFSHDPTPQRGGAMAAVRYDVNGDPLEIANVLVGPNGVTESGGAGVQTYHQHQYDPPVAADVVKGRFILGRPGDLLVASPARIASGQGNFPYALQAGWTYRPESPRDTTLSAIDHRQPQSGWVSSFSNTLTQSGSGLEAMGETDVRAAITTIAAFLAMQDVYRAAPSLKRDVTASLVQAWWAAPLTQNVITVSLGTSTRQFLQKHDGTWFSPAADEYAELTKTGSRVITPRHPYGGTGTVNYIPTRGWANDGVTFKIKNPKGDVQNWTAFRENPTALVGFGIVEQQSYRLTSWVWPNTYTVTYEYGPDSGASYNATFNQLRQVSNSSSQRIQFVGSGYTSATATPPSSSTTINISASQAGQTHTHTDVGGTQTKFEIVGVGTGQFVHNRIRNVFAADNLTTAATQYTYDGLGRLKETRDRLGVQGSRPPTQYLFARDLRAEIIDRLGYSTITYSDLFGRPVRSYDALGNLSTMAYDSRGRLTTATAPEGNQQRLEYNERNQVTKQIVAAKPGSAEAGQTITTMEASYNTTWNQPDWVKDARGRVTNYYYQYGQVTSGQGPELTPGGTRYSLSETYYASGLPMTATNPAGGTVTTGYDGNGYGDYTQYQSDLWDVSAYGNPFGQPQAVTAPRGGVWAMLYDAWGRRTLAAQPAPATAITTDRVATKTTYDIVGRPTKVERGTARFINSYFYNDFTPIEQVTKDYDAVGNVIKVTSPTGVTQFSYDVLNRVTCSAVRMNPAVYSALPSDACIASAPGPNGPDRITRSIYDAAGRMVAQEVGVGTPLQQASVRNTFTPNGKPLTLKDANGNLSQMAYDGFDRLKRLYYPASPRGSAVASTSDYEEYGYDVMGNRTSFRKRNGLVINYQYDPLNRVIVKDLPGTTTDDIYYTYTLGYQASYMFYRFNSATDPVVLQITRDAMGRITKEENPARASNQMVQSVYDVDGNRTQVAFTQPAYPFYPKDYRYSFDLAERIKGIQVPDPSGNYPYVAQFTYGQLNRRASMTYGNGTRVDYGFDGAGRLTGLSNTAATPTTSMAQTFTYSPTGQVTSQGQSNSLFTWSGHPTTTTNFTHDQLNRDASIATAGGYDANGNLTSDGVRTFTYDVENRLIGVTGGAAPLTIAYDPLGRIAKTTSGTTGTDFLYDGSRLIAEYNSANGALLRSYVHGTGTDDPLLWLEGGPSSPYASGIGNDPRWLYRDRQGSVIGTAGANGIITPYTYGPYGEPQSWAGSRFRYTGQIALPEAQLYHYKARAYDPVMGRFLQTDPIGYGDGMNIYAYVHGDPVNGVDPEGTTLVGGLDIMGSNWDRDTVLGQLGLAGRGGRITMSGALPEAIDRDDAERRAACRATKKKAAELAELFSKTSEFLTKTAALGAIGTIGLTIGEVATLGADTPITVALGAATGFIADGALVTGALAAGYKAYSNGDMTPVITTSLQTLSQLATSNALGSIAKSLGNVIPSAGSPLDKIMDSLAELASQATEVKNDIEINCKN